MENALDRSQLRGQQLPAPSLDVGDSQCDTIYDEEQDEEMTEEEENKDSNHDDDATITEGSSTCTQESSREANDEVSISTLSPEIQNLLHRFPDFGKHFQILSKIGEGK